MPRSSVATRNVEEPIHKAGSQSNGDPYEFVLSTEKADRDGDIIRQDGWMLTAFRRNPIALFGHSHQFPIGKWTNIRVENKRLMARLKLAEAGTSARIDEIRALIEQRILKAASVGFRIKEYIPIDEKKPWGAWDITKAELFETSVVSVPANSEALNAAKSLGISKRTLDLAFGRMPADQPARSRTAEKANINPRKKGNPMKIGEKISAAEDRLEELRGQVEDVMKAADDNGRDLLSEETDQIESLNDEITELERSLKGLKTAEKALAIRAESRERQQKQGTHIPATARPNENPSDLLFKMAHVALRSFVEKKSPELVLEERYAHDPRVGEILKSATTPAYTNVAGWAQELTDTALGAFVAELEPVSVYGAMAAAGTAIPFGDNNAITMPRRTSSGQVPGSFVGEGNTIPVKQAAFGAQTFNRYKAAVITAFSKELQRVSNPAIEGLLRSAITLDTGIMLDSVILDPTSAAVAGIRPASPWFGAGTQASAGTDQAAILTDLRFLIDTLSAANAGRSPRIFINPSRLTGLTLLTNANGSFVFRDELAQGRLLGIPVTVSTNVPSDMVFIMDMSDFATAFGVPEFDASEQATLVMLNDDGTDPSMMDPNAVSQAGSVHVSGAAGVTGGPAVVRSLFQTWEVGLRMVLPISWGMLRPGTAAYLTGVDW